MKSWFPVPVPGSIFGLLDIILMIVAFFFGRSMCPTVPNGQY